MKVHITWLLSELCGNFHCFAYFFWREEGQINVSWKTGTVSVWSWIHSDTAGLQWADQQNGATETIMACYETSWTLWSESCDMCTDCSGTMCCFNTDSKKRDDPEPVMNGTASVSHTGAGHIIRISSKIFSLSPSRISSVVSSSLPSPTNFSSLDVNTATDTLCSTLTTCLDDICPLSSRPARTAPSNPWLSDVLREHRTRLPSGREKMAKIKRAVGPEYVSIVSFHLSLLKSTLPNLSHFHNKINNAPDMRDLFRNI